MSSAHSKTSSLAVARQLLGMPFVLRAMFTVGLGGLVFGYDIGVVAGALQGMRKEFSMSPVQEGLVVGLLALGACIGGLIGGHICDRIGRWWTIHLQNLLFIIGALLVATSHRVEQVFCGRLVIGMGVSFSSIAELPYLTEISPLYVRGVVASAFEMMVVVGVLLAFVVNDVLLHVDGGWRWMFAVAVFAAVLQSALMIIGMPESPRWLLTNGREGDALKVLTRVHSNSEIAKVQLLELKNSISHDHVTPSSVSSLYEWRHSVILVTTVWFFAYFTGGVVIRNFAPRVFEAAQMSSEASGNFLVLLGVVKVVITALAIMHTESTGRRHLLLIGISSIFLGHCCLAFGFAVLDDTNTNTNTNTNNNQTTATATTVNKSLMSAFVIGCSLITAGYSIGFGPIAWLLQSEMFPTQIRGRAIGFCQIFSNMFMFLSNFLFVPLLSYFNQRNQSYMVFVVFALVSVGAFWIVALFVVETRAKEPWLIREHLHARAVCVVRQFVQCLCFCGLCYYGGSSTTSSRGHCCCCCCCCCEGERRHGANGDGEGEGDRRRVLTDGEGVVAESEAEDRRLTAVTHIQYSL